MPIVEYKAKAVVRALNRKGFVETMVNGDHHKFKSPDGRVTVVPYSKLGDTIYTGTLQAILRQAGISKKDLE